MAKAKDKECVDCNNIFKAYSHNTLRCPQCNLIHKKEIKSIGGKKYREIHREKYKKYLKDYYEKNKINVGKPVRVCPICKIEFISNSNHQKYCQECRSVAVKKIYQSKKIGKYNERLSENYYKDLDNNRESALKRYYNGTKNPKTRLKQIKSGATKRGLEFNISFEWYINNGWEKKCYYCNKITKNGLDRVNNKIGYTENNCVPCCINCNKAKSTLSQEEFINICLSVVKNLKLI